MAIYNHYCLVIFIIFSFGIFAFIILIRQFFINYSQDQIDILRGVLDAIYDIPSKLPGDEGVRIIFLLPHGRLADGHPPHIPYF